MNYFELWWSLFKATTLCRNLVKGAAESPECEFNTQGMAFSVIRAAVKAYFMSLGMKVKNEELIWQGLRTQSTNKAYGSRKVEKIVTNLKKEVFLQFSGQLYQWRFNTYTVVDEKRSFRTMQDLVLMLCIGLPSECFKESTAAIYMEVLENFPILQGKAK